MMISGRKSDFLEIFQGGFGAKPLEENLTSSWYQIVHKV